MRLTVGPLPPAVYWRRRAVVLGAVLLFLIVVLYSCTGQDDPTKRDAQPRAGATSSAPTASGSAGPSPSGSAPPGSAAGSSASPDVGSPPGGGPVVPGAPATGQVDPTGVAAPPPNGCTDAEMSVIPVPNPTTARRGTVVALQLKIKNLSSRTCNRDVGADLQEIYIKLGAQKVWSSDTCGTARGSDVKQLAPNVEHTYQVDWNGRDASRCADGLASGPLVNAGEYQVFGRLGSKLSEPVKLSVVS